MPSAENAPNAEGDSFDAANGTPVTEESTAYRLRAFSGIHIISPTLFPLLERQEEVFSITNFYWQQAPHCHIGCIEAPDNFCWVDAGKPEMLTRAAEIVERGKWKDER